MSDQDLKIAQRKADEDVENQTDNCAMSKKRPLKQLIEEKTCRMAILKKGAFLTHLFILNYQG